jgi:RNA polymerase sigma factor (TIGR02999 family)
VTAAHRTGHTGATPALPRVSARVIIRPERLDGDTPAPIRGHQLIRTGMQSPVIVSSPPQMPDSQTAIDRSTAPPDHATSIAQLLADLRAGRREAFDQMLPLVYRELRVAARRELAVRPSDSLSTTALVHELYLKFSRASGIDWESRAHFLGVASVAMRHILVDRARRRRADKRGGALRHVTLDDALSGVEDHAESLLEIHEALDELARLDERLARVVECRFFGGMTEQETADALGIAVRTVRRDWIKARALLYQSLGR